MTGSGGVAEVRQDGKDAEMGVWADSEPELLEEVAKHRHRFWLPFVSRRHAGYGLILAWRASLIRTSAGQVG